MLTHDDNDRLTRVGPGTAMGSYLRRYWHPIAGISEFDTRAVKPVRIMGEDLVLYRDRSNVFGLIERQCPHRRADLAYGIVEAHGLRCNYHGWCYDRTGACIEQPFDDTVRGKAARGRIAATAYPVAERAGMVWAYLGPAPIPELPDWEPFSWENGFSQVVLSTVPCNWFQCQENSIDPVHFEWMHENWTSRLKGSEAAYGPTHVKLAFDEFEFGFVYRRVKEDSDEANDAWTVGRVFLWPNAFFLGEHFEWRVPVDDENTLSVTWKYTRVPTEAEPYRQAAIPTWHGPVFDEHGEWITSHVMNQDFLAWSGQGRIADRTRENLGLSDRGIVMIRRRFFADLAAVAGGGEPKGLIRDAADNHAVPLPLMDRATITRGHSRAEIMADPRLRMMSTSFVFQAGQPPAVRDAFAAATGLEVTEFEGLQ